MDTDDDGLQALAHQLQLEEEQQELEQLEKEYSQYLFSEEIQSWH